MARHAICGPVPPVGTPRVVSDRVRGKAGADQVEGGHPTVTHPTVPSKFEAALGGVVSQKAECKLRVFLGDLLSRGGSVGLEPLH